MEGGLLQKIPTTCNGGRHLPTIREVNTPSSVTLASPAGLRRLKTKTACNYYIMYSAPISTCKFMQYSRKLPNPVQQRKVVTEKQNQKDRARKGKLKLL